MQDLTLEDVSRFAQKRERKNAAGNAMRGNANVNLAPRQALSFAGVDSAHSLHGQQIEEKRFDWTA